MKFIPRRRYHLYKGELADIAGMAIRGKNDGASWVRVFESGLERYLGTGPVLTVNSGRVALLILLKAMGLRPGDEILVPALTLGALVELLQAEGYIPVPVDVRRNTFNMDPRQTETRIGSHTRAILATHLFGRPCDVEAFVELARKKGLFVVEDCAQALGAAVNGRPVGTFGDGAIFSFDLLKQINTFGGGALVAKSEKTRRFASEEAGKLELNNRAAYKRMAAGLVEHAVLTTPLARVAAALLANPYARGLVAGGYRTMQNAARPTGSMFTEIQAAIGVRQLHSLDARVTLRRGIARRLSHLLGEDPDTAVHPGESGYFFVRRAKEDPERLRADLLAAGIDCGIGKEVADWCGDAGRKAECPNALEAFKGAVQLPLYEGLSDTELRRIAAVCRGRLGTPGPDL